MTHIDLTYFAFAGSTELTSQPAMNGQLPDKRNHNDYVLHQAGGGELMLNKPLTKHRV
jgi:hypothetical protein